MLRRNSDFASANLIGSCFDDTFAASIAAIADGEAAALYADDATFHARIDAFGSRKSDLGAVPNNNDF